jgi:RNA polymerase sigma-70 factor (ECF subfamily)
MTDSQRRDEWAELVDAHGAAAWALVRRMCRHQQDAEDAFQETAARAWKYWSGARAVANRRAWLMTIAYRACLDLRQKTKASEALVDASDAREPAPATAAAMREEATGVRAALAALPDEVREVLVLHYTGGLSIRQAASAMGIKAGTAKSRLNAGLNQLRRTLSQRRPVLRHEALP